MMPAFSNADDASDEEESSVQFSLKVGQPGNAYEREADAMADRFVSIPEPQLQSKLEKPEIETENQDKLIQSKPSLQKAGNDNLATGNQIAARLNTSQGKGSPLDETTRSRLESAFGSDFSNVRIHTDNEATQLSQDLGAQAFTHGSDIYFNQGKYKPTSREGEHLLAHELTHVVQQSKGLSGNIQRFPDEDDASVTRIIDALEGITTANDSAIILAQFQNQGAPRLREILNGLRAKASDHGLTGDGMIDWLFSDMTAEDGAALRQLLIRAGVHTEINRIIVDELYSLLSGYTSEANSREIYSLLVQYTGGGLDRLLGDLATRAEMSGDALGAWLLGDLDRANAERVRVHFLTLGAANAADYAAEFTAAKVESLLSGYTSHADSGSILRNFREPPEMSNERRSKIQEKLEAKTQSRWGQPAEVALMEDMDREDYEALRALGGVEILEYDYTPKWYEKLISGAEWVQIVLSEWIPCGILGIFTGGLAVIWDIIKIIADVFVALWHLNWSVVYWMTGGTFGSENWLKVKQFFSGIGAIFTDFGTVWDQYWESVGLEFKTIEGPLTDCRRAEFIVRKFVKAVLNIALIFLAGYGIAKGIASAIKTVQAVAGATQKSGIDLSQSRQ